MSVADRERRGNLVAGQAALAAVLCQFAALVVSLSAGEPGGPRRRNLQTLGNVDSEPGAFWLAVGLRSIGLLLALVAGYRLYQLIRARDPRTSSRMALLGLVATFAVIAAALLTQLSLAASANDFFASGVQTEPRAKDLLEGSGLGRVSVLLTILASATYGVWIGWLSLAGIQVGLLTRFLGWFGVAAGVAAVLVALAGQGLLLGWLASIGLLLLGFWPGGRGTSWETGEPEPWLVDDLTRRKPPPARVAGPDDEDPAGGQAPAPAAERPAAVSTVKPSGPVTARPKRRKGPVG